MDQSELYSETLMNLILDTIEEVIIIHDNDHNILWMNHAGEQAFGLNVDRALTMKCHELFGGSLPCADCTAGNVVIGEPVRVVRTKVAPKTGTIVECKTLPYYKDGKVELVVQCLKPVGKTEE
jgi:PAS domain-containing protein